MVIPKEMVGMSTEEFRSYMAGWIKEHYGTYLGRDVKLLELANGFELLKQRVEADLSVKNVKVA